MADLFIRDRHFKVEIQAVEGMVVSVSSERLGAGLIRSYTLGDLYSILAVLLVGRTESRRD